jgi:CubicO group peptidase (beta-lactamase class C family)
VMTRKRTAGSAVSFLTAIGVMRLVEIGKVDLDADVNQYLKLLRPRITAVDLLPNLQSAMRLWPKS